MALLWGAAAAAALLFLVLVVRMRTAWLVARLPGPPALPLVGNALLFASPHGFRKLTKQLYFDRVPLVRIWATVIPVVVLFSPDFVQALLSKSTELKKSFMYDLLKPMFGEGLITSSGSHWKRNRKRILPAFHVSVLEGFIPTFARNASILVGQLRHLADSGQVFDITPYMYSTALDVICETAMGTSVNAHEGKSAEFTAALNTMQNCLSERWMHPWLILDVFYMLTAGYKRLKASLRTIREFTQKVIEERREIVNRMLKYKVDECNNIIEPGTKRPSVFLDLMLQTEDRMTDEDLIHEVTTFIAAGHETSSVTLAFCITAMGIYQDVQRQVQEELDAIFQGSDRDPTMEDLRDMKLLERCLLETLRLFPAAPVVARTLSEDLTVGKFLVPRGCQVMVPILLLHRDPDNYRHPHRFDPDNFLPENTTKRHPYSFLPFAAGPRDCIGRKFSMMEMKVIVSTLLRHYTVEAITTRKDIHLIWKVLLKSKDPLLVRLSPRKRATR